MTAPLREGVLTPARLKAEIDRQVSAAVAEIVPPAPVEGGDAGALRQHSSAERLSARFGYAVGDVSDDQTWHHTRTLEAPATWVRPVWPYDQDTACTIEGFLIAPSASAVDPINPVDENGDPEPWIEGTMNNGGLPLTLAQQLAAADEQESADVTTGALPLAPVNGSEWPDGARKKAQNYFYGDWMPVRPLVRTDVVGGFPIIMDRVKFSAADRDVGVPGSPSIQLAISDADQATFGGRMLNGYANAGDCVATPGDFVSTTKTNVATPILQYITPNRVISVALAGDSTQTPPTNHVARAVRSLSTAMNPVVFLAGGTGGFDAEGYAGNMRRLVPGLKPSIVFIQMRSANGIASAADMEPDWRECMALAETVSGYGGVPVLMTPLPCPARILTGAVELSRLEVVRRCLAAELVGARVLDLNGYFSDGATPIAGFRRLNPPDGPLLSSDGVHPTEDGQAACSTAITLPLLRLITGL